MPNRVRYQTGAGGAGNEASADQGAGSETTPPSIRRWVSAYHLWNQTRAGRSRRTAGQLPPRAMAVPAPLIVQHTSTGQPPGTGLQPVFSAINFQGDSFVNTANATLQIINNSGQGVTVTVIPTQSCNQGYNHSYIVTVPSNGQPIEIGPFDFHYNDAFNLVHIFYSFYLSLVSGVTVAAVAP